MTRTRDALLITAFRLFMTKGYDQTSMQDLARACGVSKGAFHHYFPRKQDLLAACLDRFLLQFLPEADAQGRDIATLAQDAAGCYAKALAFVAAQGIPLGAYQAFVWSQVRDAPGPFAARQTHFLNSLAAGFEPLHPGQGATLARRLFAVIEGTGVLLSIDPPQNSAGFSEVFETAVAGFFATLGTSESLHGG